MICICINIYSVPLYIFANGTKTQSNMSLNVQQQKQCVFKYICTGRFLVSFRKQTQDFIILSSLQGHLMLCGNTFSYISSRLLLIASSNSTYAYIWQNQQHPSSYCSEDAGRSSQSCSGSCRPYSGPEASSWCSLLESPK